MKNASMGITSKYAANIAFFFDKRCLFPQKKCLLPMFKVSHWYQCDTPVNIKIHINTYFSAHQKSTSSAARFPWISLLCNNFFNR